MKTLSVGVVGCGSNSDNHLRVFSNTKGVRLAAVCDIEPTSAERKGSKYGVEHVLTNYDSMLDLDLDLIDIITPTPTHAQLAIRALEAGCNVLVEKPMALTSKECQEMISAARKSGRALCVAHSLKFLDSIIETKSAIDREALTVSRVRFSYFFAQPYPGFTPKWVFKEENGGILWEALVHHIYLCEHFLEKTQSVYAVANKSRQPVDDSLTLILRDNGRAGICEYEFDVKQTQRLFQLVTTSGDRFDADLTTDLLLRKSRRSKTRWEAAYKSLSDDINEPIIKWTRLTGNFLKAGSYEKGLPMEKSFFRLIGHLLSFLAGSESSPPVMAEEGLRSITVLEAAAKSIETGTPHSPE